MTWNEFLLLYHKYIAEMAQHDMILDDSTRCMALQGAVKHVFNTRQIVLVIKKENLTQARLKDEIQAEHQRMKGNNPTWKRDPDEDELDEPAFMGMTYAGANDDPRGTKRKFNLEDTAYCTYHEKYGHWTRDCRCKNNHNHDGREVTMYNDNGGRGGGRGGRGGRGGGRGNGGSHGGGRGHGRGDDHGGGRGRGRGGDRGGGRGGGRGRSRGTQDANDHGGDTQIKQEKPPAKKNGGWKSNYGVNHYIQPSTEVV